MSEIVPKYSRIKIKILKIGKPTYWYANLIGKTIEVEKQTFEDSIAYKSLEKEAAYFFEEDVKEIIKRIIPNKNKGRINNE